MKIAFNETSKLQLKHPVSKAPLYLQDKNGKDIKEKPCIAVIYGKHTSVYKNAYNRFLKELQKNSGDDSDPTKSEEIGLSLLEACVERFENLDGLETEHGKVDPNDKRDVMKKAFWIKDQVDNEITKLGNFIQEP